MTPMNAFAEWVALQETEALPGRAPATLSDETAKRIEKLADQLDPEPVAINLAAALRLLWTAIAEASEEIPTDALCGTLWHLFESAELVVDLIHAEGDARYFVHGHALAKAEQAKQSKPATRRKKAKEANA